jgi:hypothetical protein
MNNPLRLIVAERAGELLATVIFHPIVSTHPGPVLNLGKNLRHLWLKMSVAVA